MLSIKPEFYGRILSGDKRFEFRRKIFKREVSSVVLYVTSPIKMVMCEFDVNNIHSNNPEVLWTKFHQYAGIKKGDFDAYFNGLSIGYAIEIGDLRMYDTPLDIKHFGVRKAPQSYVYIT